MTISNSIPFICSDAPIDYVLQNQGAVLILRDALFDPTTQKYHDIKLVRSGWKFLGFDLGGGSKFTGITEDVARQIQSTYGILLKTLGKNPVEAAFWGNAQETSYLAEANGAQKFSSGSIGNAKFSYPFGRAKEDVFLSSEDAALFGEEHMTLHDAINGGIWNAKGWPKMAAAIEEPSDDDEDRPAGAARYATPRPDKNETPTPDAIEETPGGETRLTPRLTPGSNRSTRSETSTLRCESPITSFPSIPVYQVSSTPIESGYDDAPFEERKRRVISHLDGSGPIPFSSFVDNNSERQIHPILYNRMIDTLRRLSVNPDSSDPDSKKMKELFKHWFRAAYHYLEKNSKPGDGYPRILNVVSRKAKDAHEAESKAKEIYWRRHATDFWITFVDLFSRETINIDPFHKSISEKTSLDPWFFESFFN